MTRARRGRCAAALLVVIPLVAAAVLRHRFVVVRVEGPSMQPTLRPGERVLVRRVGLDRVRRGHIVVLAFPPDPPGAPPASDNPPWLIKRVVALPGDPVPVASLPGPPSVEGQSVPARHLVVRGDNPAGGFDSRRAGYFTADDLLGVVLRRMGA